MSETQDPKAALDTDAPGPRIAFERLRERTDELELIFSGLIAFALLALPSVLFEHWLQSEAHVDGGGWMVLVMGFLFISGLSYLLGTLFVLHLAIRGYWVGLIGLRASFPRGIRWDDVSSMGPIARAFYRERLPDLMQAIENADRAASVLFALATLAAVMLLWSGLLAAAIVGLGTALGWLLGDVERVALSFFTGVYALTLLMALSIWLLDAVLARRNPSLQQRGWLLRTVRFLLQAFGTIFPQRILQPVQLTLQSNLSARVFHPFIFGVMALAPMLGVLHLMAASEIALLRGYIGIEGEALEQGLRSAHYEDQRGHHDRMLRLPMIPSDRIQEAWLRVFLPHLPQRDNPLLRERCEALDPGRADAAAAAPDCVRALWTASLDGEPVALADFLPAERRDLGLRGLQGYVPMQGLSAGRHDLHLVWNAGGGEEGRTREREFHIPFWLSPGFELALEPAKAPEESAPVAVEAAPAPEPASSPAQ